MLKIGLISLLCAAALISCLQRPAAALSVTHDCLTQPLSITEVQTGAAPAGSTTTNYRFEFIELFNCSDAPLDLGDYQLTTKNASGVVTATIALSGVAHAEGFFVAMHAAYKNYLGNAAPSPGVAFAVNNANINALAADGGSVVLGKISGEVVDSLVYSAAEGHAPVPPSGQSLKRCTSGGEFMQTYTNAADFVITDPPALSALFKLGPPCPTVDPPIESTHCEGVDLSELLPNPAGSDTGKEFIELFNSTPNPVSLFGCSLRIGETGKEFALPDEQLESGGYRVFYDSETALALPNKTAAAVWLLRSESEQKVAYADDMIDNQAWALIAGVWQPTNKASPGETNVLVEDAPFGKGGGESTAVPCDEDQERNPATNRCRKITQATSVQPCKPDQQRNPETNRCRTVAAAANTLTSCKPGQERNPDTNRCRSVLAAESTPKPCATGQERNADTNRCRKVMSPESSLAAVKDVQASGSADPRWWLAGVAMVGAIGYGVYEWRHDITAKFGKFRKKRKLPKTG